jgi:NAD dependent epimerase/dehydratase family enzyme
VDATSGKVLVSGSSGLIGATLCPFLAASGYQVTRLVRNPSAAEGEIAWDPDKPLSSESISGFDAVVHLAGESIVGRWTDAKKAAIRHSRVAGTKNLTKALTETAQRPRVFISASAILADVCREWEFATTAAADAGIRTAQTRFGIVLSTAGGALAKMLPPFRLGIGGNMGNGRQWWSWIDLQDVVRAIEHVIKNSSLHGAVNVVSPNPVTNAEFTKTLASLLSRPAVFPMPAFLARLALGQVADELLLASQRVEPAKLIASGYAFQQLNLRQALQGILKA